MIPQLFFWLSCPHPLAVPLCLCSAALDAAAQAAFQAFGGAGVDYLVHNAGQHAPPLLLSC